MHEIYERQINKEEVSLEEREKILLQYLDLNALFFQGDFYKEVKPLNYKV